MRMAFIVAVITLMLFTAGANADPITEQEVQAMIDRHANVTGKAGAERRWRKVLLAIQGKPGGISLKRARARAEKARDKKPKWHKRWLRVVEAIELAQQKEQTLHAEEEQQSLTTAPATQATGDGQEEETETEAQTQTVQQRQQAILQALKVPTPDPQAVQNALNAHSFGGALARSSESGMVSLAGHGGFGYGYWLSENEDTGAWSVGVFADGFTKTAPFGEGDHIAGSLTSDSNETATYSGKATGLSVRDTNGNGALASGRFNADVAISAKFLPSGAEFSGTVNNFSGGNHVGSGWSVTLQGNTVSDTSGGVGVADGGGASSEWIAVPYSKAADERPFGIAGAFNATFTDGQALGAFGASE